MFSVETIAYCVIDIDGKGQKVTSRLSNRQNTFVSNPVLLEANLDTTKTTILKNIAARKQRSQKLKDLHYMLDEF